MFKNQVFYTDIQYILNSLEKHEVEKLRDTSILITGCAGFLGFYFMSFLSENAQKLGIRKVVGIDNFKLGTPIWIEELSKSKQIELLNLDITNFNDFDKSKIEDCDYIIHMASIASPTYYRKYPIETIDANVWGLRSLFDFYKNKAVKGFLYFSSSEVYGNPDPKFIPTSESYRGNVAMIGPRACYDEAKRFSETLCYLYAENFGMPISIVRPFNNYGPGMKINDKRVPADFAKAVIENKNIVLYSDGTPTRTFCYVTDAIVGYIKAMLYEPFDYFNIGIDYPEISIKNLAEIYAKVGVELFDYNRSIEYKVSEEQEYLTHNPSRRCPNITKAKLLLNYCPSISVEQGVFKFLDFLKQGGVIH